MARRQNQKAAKAYPNEFHLFICEDEKSMCYYLNGLKPYLKQNIVLEARHSYNGNSAQAVYKCAEQEYNRINRNPKAYANGFKVIACFDKDNNNINDINSIMNKQRKKVIALYNNPCYELWLYLHTSRDIPPFASSQDCAQRCMNKINQKYGKHFNDINEMKRYSEIFEIIKTDFNQAIMNADEKHFSNYNETYTNAQTILKEIVDLQKIR